MTSPIQITKSSKLGTLPPVEKLGFGQYFTDHMFCLDYKEGEGWKNPRILPYSNFSLDPAACVFHYGQALFEGMKAFRRRDGQVALFRPEFNAKRMQDGAARLGMAAPPSSLFLEGINELVRLDQNWIPSQRGAALYIRPTLIATEGFLGVRPSKEYLFYVILSPVGSYYKEGLNPIKIWVEQSYVRATPGGLGATKAGANYAASLLAAMHAKQKGYAQVLWLDTKHEYIEEVGTMNVFFVIDDQIITPELDGSILAGGTRESVISLLKEKNYKIVERKIAIKEIIDAQKNGHLKEAFGTGTAAVISPIGELFYDNKTWVINNSKMGEISTLMYNEITAIQYGDKVDTHNWVKIL